MESIHVILPDGKSVEVPPGTRIDEIAPSNVTNGHTIAAKVDGRLVDLSRPLLEDATLAPVFPDSREGTEILRHSTAHLMAHAVKRLFPETQVTIGPVIEDGFYYDFKRDRPFTPEDIEKIEARMEEIAKSNLKVTREELLKSQAIELFRGMGEDYKVAIIEDIPDEIVSLYRQGNWVDLCRGPHVPSTGVIKAFKLTGVAGAYWRGNEKNEMLQRIYGTAWPTKQALKEHLRLLEEAKKRDHRKLGQELGLFMISDVVGPGLPIWLPKGAMVRSILERYIVDIERSMGYQHVNTPQLARLELYKQSGHWDHFKANMYPPMEFENKEQLVLRPMNCPHHITIYKHGLHSYRDLPVRLAELGTMYRYERSGALSGLSRVRAMTLNDAHIFVTPDQIKEAFSDVMKLVEQAYKDLGITQYRYRLSLGERVLREAMTELGLPFFEAKGEAAFYGPKLDIQIADVMGHEETYSTIQ